MIRFQTIDVEDIEALEVILAVAEPSECLQYGIGTSHAEDKATWDKARLAIEALRKLAPEGHYTLLMVMPT